MTLDDVKKRVAKVTALDARQDDEGAHIEEDKLYRDLLGAIAGGACVEAAACALEALKTQELEFSRWCA